MVKSLLVLALVLLTSPVLAAILLIDGDTIDINGIRIRIVDIDTPETFRSRCENELTLGLKAKERLRQLLDAGPVTYTATGIDRYNRVLAKVYVGNVDVGAKLVAEGYALPYQPGPEAKATRLKVWCPSNKRNLE